MPIAKEIFPVKFTSVVFVAGAQKISNTCCCVCRSHCGETGVAVDAFWYKCGKLGTCQVCIDKTTRFNALCIYVMSINRFSTGEIDTVFNTYHSLCKMRQTSLKLGFALSYANSAYWRCIQISKDISFVFTVPKSRSKTCVA